MLKYFYLLFVFFASNVFAQKIQNLIPTGTWRTHLTYHNARSLAVTEDRIYASSDNGLFYIDKVSKETFIISKLDGLNDNQFSKIAYHKTLKKLLITYRNGNMDILSEKNGVRQISNINDILLSNRLINKQINHITLYNNLAYLSMGSGVVVVDLERNKIFENYLQLGNNASTVNTYASAVVKDSIFLATDNGVLVASLASNVNRQDPKNWKPTNFKATVRIRALATKNNKLYYSDDAIGIFEYENGKSTLLPISQTTARNFFGMMPSSDGQNLLVCSAQLLIKINAQNVATVYAQNNIIAPQEADIDNNTIWVADYGNGVLNNANTVFSPAYPKGTYNAASFDLLYFQEKILAVSGGYDAQNIPTDKNLGFYIFEKGEWTNYNTDKILAGIIPIPAVKNITQAAYSPDNKIYFATFSEGILVLDIAKNTVTNFASPILPSQKVSALTVDRKGALWIAIANSNNIAQIYKLENNTWKGFTLQSLASDETIVQLLADEANNIWARIRKPNDKDFIAVWNDKGQQKILKTFSGDYQFAGNQINTMELDKDGDLWIGGNKGIRILNSAASVLQRNSINLNIVRFEQRQLFRDEPITAIKVDGGNRKWIGTDKGAWLFSSTGAEQILHFSAENSPLLSNTINAIEIHEKTSEVFFATSDGLVSYRGDASEASSEFIGNKIFPNPVPANFQGFVTMEGLAENSNVKITDISGRLVYETQAQGGTAIWRATDYTGRRANAGMYLVFCTNMAGEQTLVGKIAVLD
jgi:ligand-binding sensor domain-containing protein